MAIFKAYDIRGLVPSELDAATARRIGAAFVRFLAAETGFASPMIVVGRDMRLHSGELAAAFIQGMFDEGGRVIDLGLCTTPMLYFAVGSLERTPAQPSGGAMITASHNGPEYNGLKLCRAGAAPISADSGLNRIRDIVAEIEAGAGAKAASDVAAAESAAAAGDAAVLKPKARVRDFPHIGAPDAVGMPPAGVSRTLWNSYYRYLFSLKRRWPANTLLAVDPANAMGCFYVPLLTGLGAKVRPVNDTLDGTFPSHEANPIKAKNLVEVAALVKESNAHLGVAFDGDADRVVFVDELGNAAPSDLVTAILAQAFIKHYPHSKVLFDLRSSRAVSEFITEAGGIPVRERVGHSFMKATMRAQFCIFGGELSGHYYHRSCFYSDNAVATVVELLNVMGETHLSLSALINSVRRYAQSGEINYHVADKDAAMKRLADTFGARAGAETDWLDGVTVQFADWWFNVRPSNTEPLLRLNVEAADDATVAARVVEIAAIIGGKPED